MRLQGIEVVGNKFELDFCRGEGIELYCVIAVTKGRPYWIGFGAAEGQEMHAAIPATMADGVKILVALDDYASGKIGKFALWGTAIPALVADGVAAGDHLEVLNGGTSFIVDGSTGSTTKTVRTAGLAKEANASGAAALKNIVLNLETVTVSDS